MGHLLVSELSWTTDRPSLHLRLLHRWIAGNPNQIAAFTEYSTLWTDAEGTLIQGVASTQLTSHFDSLIQVGKLYFVSKFSQRKPKTRYRSCSTDRYLLFTLTTEFSPCTKEYPDYCVDIFEFKPFKNLHDLLSAVGLLVDVIGRLDSASPVTYFHVRDQTRNKQIMVLKNERDATLTITLWGEFAEPLALPNLIGMDNDAPVIVALTALNLSTWRGTIGALNTSATRILIAPAIPKTGALATAFANVVGTLGVLPAECDTLEQAEVLYRESFQTIHELQVIQMTKQLGGKFRVVGIVIDIGTSLKWCYLDCARCYKAVLRHESYYWCSS